MTWIKTIRPREADEALQQAMQGYRALYPPEYRTEVEILKPIAGREQGGDQERSHPRISARTRRRPG